MSRLVTPLLAADCVVVDQAGTVLMVQRKNPPYKGYFALPGGFVEVGETVEQAAQRELTEETGPKATELSLVGVYSRPDRDPRGHVCSVAFLVGVEPGYARAGDDAEAVAWIKNLDAVEIAFDHREIISDALQFTR